MKKVLIICANPPWPPDGGTPLRSWGWLRTASKVAKVGVVSLTTGRKQEKEESELKKYCDLVRLVAIPRVTIRRLRDLFLAMLNKNPYVVQAAQSNQMVQAVAETIDKWQPDIVQAEWIGAAPYLEEARKQGLPTIYAAHNVEHQAVVNQRNVWQQRLLPYSSETLRAVETSCGRKADLVVTVTEQDKRWFQLLNKRVICIPNSIHPAEYDFVLPSRRPRGTVVFVGHLRYPPNIEAAMELITRIFPSIQKQLPDARCLIAGRQPSSALRRLVGSNPSVEIQGDVKDIRTVWSQASILICPLHSGGGSRLKLLEAAACGVPIVGTPFSASGLALAPERDYFAASKGVELIDASVAMLRDAGRFDELSRQARETVMQQHNWDTLQEKLQQLYEDLAYHHR